MDTNSALYKVLVGVDERRSATLMNQQLADTANQMKELKVKIKVDTGFAAELQNSIQKMQNTVPKDLKLTDTSILKDQQLAIDDLMLKYRNMGGAIEKVLVDTKGNFDGVIMKVQDLQNNTQKITFDKDLNEKSSTFFTGFNQNLKELRTGINETEKSLVKITKEIASGRSKPGMADEQSRLTNKLAEDYGKLHLYIQRSTVATAAHKKVLTALTVEEHKSSQAAIENARAIGKQALGYEAAKTAASNYKKDLALLSDVKLGKDVGESEETINKRLAAQTKLAKGYTDITAKMQSFKEEEERTFNNRQIQSWEKSYSSAISKVSQSSSNLEKLYEKLRYAMEHGDTQGMEVLNIKIKNAEDALREAQLAAVEFGNQLDYVETQGDMNKVTTEVTQIKDALLSAESMAERLEGRFGKLKVDTAGNKSMKELVALYEKGAISVDQFAREVYGSSAKVKKASKENSNYAQMTKSLEISVNDADGKTRAFTATIDKNAQAVREVGGHMDTTKAQVSGFSGQIMDAAKKIATWGLSTKIVYGTWRAFQDGIKTVKELDNQLTQIAIVQGKGREVARAYGDEYVDIAIKMAQSVQDVAKLNTELIRQGLSMKESQARAETIMKLSSAGMVTMEQSLQVITTGVNALGEAHQKVADVILKASMLSASDVEGLGEAFTKTASGAKAAGLSIEQTSALLATMKEVTQEGDSQLGTSLKSMLARFNKINEETGELNAELNNVQTAIESVGVEFLDSQGQIRSFYDIVQDLSVGWEGLDKNTRAYIATQAAGVRQQNRFFALMDNFNKVQAINNDLTHSAGTLQQSYMTYLDSTEASSKRLQASLDKLWMNFIDSNTLRGLTDIANFVVTIVDKVGLLSIALTVLGLKLSINVVATKALFTSFVGGAKLSFAAIIDLKAALIALGLGLKGVATTALALVKTLISIAPQLILIGIASWAIGKVIEFFTKAKEAALAAKQAQVDYYNQTVKMVQSQHTQEASIKELGEEYLALEQKVRQAGGAHALSAEELERYYQIQAQLKEIIPDLTSYEDSRGRVILEGVYSVNELTTAYDDLLKARIREAALGSDERIIDILKEREKAIKTVRKEQKNLINDINQAIDRDFSFDEETRTFSASDFWPSEEIIAEAKRMTAELAVLEDKELQAILAKGQAVMSEIRLQLMDEYGDLPDELSKILSQESVLIKIGNMSPEEMMPFAQELKYNFDKALTDTDFAGGLSTISDVFEEITELGRQHAEGLIDSERYEEQVAVITDALRVIAETASEETKLMIEATLEALEGGATNAPIILEEAVETIEEIAARHKEATDKFITDYNSLKSELVGMATLYGQVTNAKVTDAQVDAAILESYPQWMQFLGDRLGLENALSAAYTDTANAQAEAYIVMLENTGQFTMSSLDLSADLFNGLADNYVQDIMNAKSRAEARLAVEHSLIKSAGAMWTKFFKATGDGIIIQVGALESYAAELASAGVPLEGIESALGNIQSLANSMNKQANTFSAELNKIVLDTSKINGAMGGIKNHADSINKALAKKGGAAGSAKDLADATKEAEEALKAYNEAMKATQDATKEVFDFALEYIEWIEEQKREAMEKTFKDAEEAAEEAYETIEENIEKEKEAQLEVLDIKEKGIKAEEELLEYLKKRQELQEGIVDLEYQIAIASFDSTIGGVKRRRELEEALAEERKQLAETEEERLKRIEEEAYARERAFIESQAEWERIQAEQTKNTKIANAQTVYDAEKAFLDQKYSDENNYLAAKQATQSGMIANLQGEMIPLVAAFKELAIANGEFWTFFGQQQVADFGTKVQEVLAAIKKLGFETIQTWKEVASAAKDAMNAANAANAAKSNTTSTNPTTSSPPKPVVATVNPQTALNKEYQAWLKSLWINLGNSKMANTVAVDGQIGPATRAASSQAAIHNRTPKGMDDILTPIARGQAITANWLNQLKKLSITAGSGGGSGTRSTYMAYADGGKVEHTGPAMVHGSKTKPEYVFNYAQFKDLAKMIAKHELTIPNIKNAVTTQPILVTIDKFIEVKGSVDKDTLPELKRMSDDAIAKLTNKLKGMGK